MSIAALHLLANNALPVFLEARGIYEAAYFFRDRTIQGVRQRERGVTISLESI